MADSVSGSAERIADGWKTAADRMGTAFENLEAKVGRSSPKKLASVTRGATPKRSPDVPALALARVKAANSRAGSKAPTSVHSIRTTVDGLSVANAAKMLRPVVRAKGQGGSEVGGTQVSVDLLEQSTWDQSSACSWDRSSTLSSSRSQRMVTHVLDKILELLHRKECRIIDLFRSRQFNVDIDDQGKDKTMEARGAWLGAKVENMELDMREWTNLLAAAGLHLTRREMMMVFKHMDIDHNRAIDVEEFELAMHKHRLKVAMKHEAEHCALARLAMKVQAGVPVKGALVHKTTVKRVARQHREAVKIRNNVPQGSPAAPRVGPGAVRKMPGNLNLLNSTRGSPPPRESLSHALER